MNLFKTKCLEQLGAEGYALVRHPSKESLLDLATPFGPAVPSSAGKPLVDTLVPRPQSHARPNSISAVVGLGPFPFHTDAVFHREPPRFVLMRSTGERSGVATLILPLLLNVSEAELSQLRHDLWKVSTPQASFYTSSLSDTGVLRVDPFCMIPIGRSSNATSELLQDVGKRASISRVEWDDPDVVLVVDNWTTLHARECCSEQEATTRRLERVLVRRIADVGL